jgi:membrane glycosyltransferase
VKVFASEHMDAARLNRRRFVFFSSVFVLTSLATWFVADLYWRGGLSGLEIVLLVLFVPLFAHIAVGFCTALAGFYVINRGGDSSRISASAPPGGPYRLASTAVVMPVFNEDVSRVFEGLRVVFKSVQKIGRRRQFRFFRPERLEPAQPVDPGGGRLGRALQAGGRLREDLLPQAEAGDQQEGRQRRRLPQALGKNYRYMVVLDADSIMTGEALARLVTMMEANPSAGIIQTAPRTVRGESLYARLQAFANRIYSPIYLAGLNYWQQHEGNYWGHNAIIRVQPFMDHCSLPELPGNEPFGGRILSHDFVEAALMRKAGWAVWLAHDVEGSYEEGPPTLIESAKRDRRWCQGNLQHAWLLTARGFRPANRFHLLMGVMAYVSSPLWLLFLILSTVEMVNQASSPPADAAYMLPDTTSLFGYLVAVPEALTLFSLTMLLLFLPKFVSVVVLLGRRDEAAGFGGRWRVAVSAVLEALGSMLLAPINMIFNTKFVIFTLLGQGVQWVAQKRSADEDGTDWREAIITHGPQTVFGLVWGVSSLILIPAYFAWLSPVLAGLVLSIPLSIFLSKGSFGRRARELGVFVTPEEMNPPEELRHLELNLAECYRHLPPFEPLRADYGLMQAVLDPYINAMHVALLRQRRTSAVAREWFSRLQIRLLREGPARFTTKEKMALLLDPQSMIYLHRELWSLPSESLAEWWRLAMRQYNVLAAVPSTALYR